MDYELFIYLAACCLLIICILICAYSCKFYLLKKKEDVEISSNQLEEGLHYEIDKSLEEGLRTIPTVAKKLQDYLLNNYELDVLFTQEVEDVLESDGYSLIRYDFSTDFHMDNNHHRRRALQIAIHLRLSYFKDSYRLNFKPNKWRTLCSLAVCNNDLVWLIICTHVSGAKSEMHDTELEFLNILLRNICLDPTFSVNNATFSNYFTDSSNLHGRPIDVIIIGGDFNTVNLLKQTSLNDGHHAFKLNKRYSYDHIYFKTTPTNRLIIKTFQYCDTKIAEQLNLNHTMIGVMYNIERDIITKKAK